MKHDPVENNEADETIADLPEAELAGAAPPPPAESETAQLKDRLLRLQADFDNYRKRSARERADWQSFATEQLLLDLLPVVDHYELGLANAEKNDTPPAVLNGFKLVYDQFLGVLRKQGVTPVAAAPGAAFDPHRHEAISHVPSEEHPADVIIAETRRGYTLGEKLIRPLQVVVSSGPGSRAAGDGK
jgi:molecular chaperone GrpE